MAGPAIEDDPLDSVSGVLPRPHDSRVQRGSLRQITQRLQEEGFQFLLPLGDLLGRLRVGHFTPAAG